MKKWLTWWREGWKPALFGFVIMEVAALVRKKPFTPEGVAIDLIVWTIGAFWIGSIFLKMRRKREQE